jgi:hypothetical protein
VPPSEAALFLTRGWCRFPVEPSVVEWVAGALPAARAAVRDPANADWHVCGGTWFVGVDALANDATGRVGRSGPLSGAAKRFATAHLGGWPALHKAQVSVVYPGYPQPRAGESAGAFRYRQRRDAAHVDGILAEGPKRRRFVREPHAFILGLPLTEAGPDAAPLVVWEGSHRIVGDAFRGFFKDTQADPQDVDVTDIYQETRAAIFEICRRVTVAARPGEAVLVHRHTLHGVAPWAEGASAGPDGRMIAYFRPLMLGRVADWLNAP